METHNIDSAIRKAIHEAEDYYDVEANMAKNKIWNSLQIEKQNKPKLIFFRLLAAACILLLIGITITTIILINDRTKIDTLVELNKSLKLETDKNSLNLQQSERKANASLTDTIFIREKIVVSKPLVTTQVITDTVYIQQIVYVEKEIKNESTIINQSQKPSDLAVPTTENNYKTEIHISNNEPLKKERGHKFRIRFGGAKDQFNSGITGFTTKL